MTEFGQSIASRRDDIQIGLDHVSVDFPIYNARGRSLKLEVARRTTGGRLGVNAENLVLVRALNDIDLHFAHGERIGLVGHNGAGKTTLLRVLAGVYEPTHGVCYKVGRVAALADLALGFDPEASGFENITIRGMMLGLNRAEIDALTPEIAAFTELGDYLAVPVRTYSSGMLLRLAFAVSTSVVPDILLLDEWISVGDASFVAKAEERLKNLVGQAGVLVLASHSLTLLRSTCTRVIWLENGRVRDDGPPERVVDDYQKFYAR